MIIMGILTDYHPEFQRIRLWIPRRESYGEQRLEHGEHGRSCVVTSLPRARKVQVGMEASGHARWFERLLAELTFEL